MSAFHQRGGGDHSRPTGLGSAVTAACRGALRALLAEPDCVAGLDVREHLQSCAFCAARVRASATVAAWVSTRPEMPAALASKSLLDGVYERAAYSVAQGPVGSWLEQSVVASPSDSWTERDAVDPATDLESPFRDQLLGELVRNPAYPDPRVWSGVCRSILDGVASERVIRRRINWRTLLAGAAAAAVIGVVATFEQTPTQPEIVFADLDRAPDVEFAIVRYGSRH